MERADPFSKARFWTLPSHASLLTGQYPSEHQATSGTGQLPQEASTLAENLDRAGYRTGAFVSNPWLGDERGFAQGFPVFEAVWETSRIGRIGPGFARQESIEATGLALI